jgi:hypothetical protein
MPILGGYGNASEYAYRGFIVELPDPFDWVDLYDVDPGQEYRAGYAKITGIKSPLPVRVSIGSSFSLISNVFDNGQTVTFDNNKKNEASFDEYSNPNNRFQSGLGFDVINDLVENNQSINLSIIAPNTLKSDFSKTYTTNVSVGRSDQDWIVQTRPIDDTPNDFNFLNIETTTSTLVESNEITVSGLESGYSFDASITTDSGNIIVNNVNRGTSFGVFNDDKIKLSFTTPETFDTTTNITIELGTYSETWRVDTEVENLDVTFTPIDFTDRSNLQLNTNYDSNQITISGLSLNSDLPVTLSNSNASYEVERSGSVVKSFTDSPIEVVNNDKIRLRLRSSGSYSRNVSTIMTIGNTSADWVLTTRAAPPPPPLLPTITLNASPQSIQRGSSITLTWSSTNATSVTSSNFGATTVNGNITVSPSVTTRYTITVAGPGGSATTSSTVSVSPVTTTYNIIPVTRYVNPTTGDHYCTTTLGNSAPSGYLSEGTLCTIYSTQAPGTTVIFDDDDGDRNNSSGRPYSGIMGYAYKSPPSVPYVIIYALTNGSDTMWSTRISEGPYVFLRTEFYAPTGPLTITS